MKVKSFLLIFGLGFCHLAQASKYWQTLPKGRFNVILHQVETNDVGASYNGLGESTPFYLKHNLDAKSLENLTEFGKEFFEGIRNMSEEAYDAFSFGEYELEYAAKINVRYLALGAGLTDRLTLYFGVPYWDANVNFGFNRSKGNNHQKVHALIKDKDKGEFDRMVQAFTEILPDSNGPLLQSVLINNFGYKPLGNWQGKGWGDVELGLKYRLHQWDDGGLAMTLGGIVPTGKEDDPDMLQDVAFGDGQWKAWDMFVEFGGGTRVFSWLGLQGHVRGTYQLPYTSRKRVATSKEFPLAAQSDDFYVKPGTKIKATYWNNVYFKEWLIFMPSYTYEHIERYEYESPHVIANEVLAENTGREQHFVGAGLRFTSVPLYQKKIFAVPFTFTVQGQTMVRGRNTPRYDRYDFDFSLFF